MKPKKTKNKRKPTDKNLVRALAKSSKRAVAGVIERERNRHEMYTTANAETFEHLSNFQLRRLAWMRLNRENKNRVAIFKEPKLVMEGRSRLGCSFIISSANYADEIMYIVFDKFYPDEFMYLLELGCFVKRKKEIT